MFSSLWSWLSSQTESRLLDILSAGPIPKHVAFVMDGNRRYARSKQKPVHEGHRLGFVALRTILELCLRLDVKCVSVYAFALDNFSRPRDEVDALMSLAEEKLNELCQKGDLLEQYGVRLNVVGRKELLPLSVQQAAQRAEDLTRHNDRAVFNLCMSYGSRDEITTAVESAVNESLETGIDITEEDIERHLATSLVGSPPLDILIRTSGVIRLSDYLLWQTSKYAQIHFSSSYWPDFGFWDFLPAILSFQRKQWGAA